MEASFASQISRKENEWLKGWHSEGPWRQASAEGERLRMPAHIC